MSQEKIDKRKKNKAELLHNAKKRMRNTLIIVSVILVVAGAFSSVVCYKKGYDKGEADGSKNMMSLFNAFNGSQSEETTSAKDGETEKATDANSKETTAAEETATTEAATTEAETQAN